MGWRSSAVPHRPHLSDPARRSRYVDEIAAGRLPDGYGIDDGAALHFVDSRLSAVVSEQQGRSVSLFELRVDRGPRDQARREAAARVPCLSGSSARRSTPNTSLTRGQLAAAVRVEPATLDELIDWGFVEPDAEGMFGPC